MKGEFGTEKPLCHPGKILLRNVNDVLRRRRWEGALLEGSIREQPERNPFQSHLIDLAQNHRLHQWILHHFSEHSAIAATNNQHLRIEERLLGLKHCLCGLQQSYNIPSWETDGCRVEGWQSSLGRQTHPSPCTVSRRPEPRHSHRFHWGKG